MGRGLGYQQRLVLEALAHLDRERAPGWHPPCAVIAAVERMTGADRDKTSGRIDRADGLQLEHARAMVARGVLSFRSAVQAIEARIAERERWRSLQRARRGPNTVRREARAGEDFNPSRIFAALARRGLVDRLASCGPGSLVRLRAG